MAGLETFAFDLQFGLGGGAFGSGFSSRFGGSGWSTILRDIRTSDPVIAEYGIRGSNPDDRIADAGALSFALNNGAWNTNSTLGWYSPLNAVKRGGFNFNIPTRLIITYNGIPYYKFYGKLANITVTPGAYEERIVRCVAKDLFDDWARLPVPALPTQINKRGDELIQLILNALATDLQPPLRAIETGLETHPIAFDTLREDTMTVREALNVVCLSDFGRFYGVGTTASPGGLYVYRNRHYAALHPTVACSFDNDMARNGLSVPGSRDDLVSTLQVTVHPTRTDPSATTVLFSLETTSTFIAAGETNDTLFGPYRDPISHDQIGGTAQVTPVATTDYLMNSTSDGFGVDLTANFTVVASFTGAGVHWTITNAGPTGAYVTKLQCRGEGIYRSVAVITKPVDSAFGERAMQFDMPFQNDVNVGQDIASYLASVLSRPLARVYSVTFLANLTPTRMAAALQLEPGDRIAISEQVTGLDAEEFLINGVRLEVQPSATTPVLWCTWYLEPADTQRYWLIGQVGASELGVSTVLGF